MRGLKEKWWKAAILVWGRQSTAGHRNRIRLCGCTSQPLIRCRVFWVSNDESFGHCKACWERMPTACSNPRVTVWNKGRIFVTHPNVKERGREDFQLLSKMQVICVDLLCLFVCFFPCSHQCGKAQFKSHSHKTWIFCFTKLLQRQRGRPIAW